jgi:hypothetical protein
MLMPGAAPGTDMNKISHGPDHQWHFSPYHQLYPFLLNLSQPAMYLGTDQVTELFASVSFTQI